MTTCRATRGRFTSAEGVHQRVLDQLHEEVAAGGAQPAMLSAQDSVAYTAGHANARRARPAVRDLIA